jgi:hypothetical protein
VKTLVVLILAVIITGCEGGIDQTISPPCEPDLSILDVGIDCKCDTVYPKMEIPTSEGYEPIKEAK